MSLTERVLILILPDQCTAALTVCLIFKGTHIIIPRKLVIIIALKDCKRICERQHN